MNYLLSMLLLFVLAQAKTGTKQVFRRMSVAQIVGADALDGKAVEVHGSLRFGFETSMLRDSSSCKTIRNCSVWVEFKSCVVASGAARGEKCEDLIERMPPNGRGILELENVVLRGIVETVRKDVSYEPSAPRSVRIGFGHLSAYPAQITVSEMEILPK